MSDRQSDGWLIGYCTNVHAGSHLQETKDNLLRYAVNVYKQRQQSTPLPIGLWLSAQSLGELNSEAARADFAQWLCSNELNAYTINGFPYFDFHESVVKHRVYTPDWSCPERAKFTRDLADLLATILPPGAEGSISTLPIAWGSLKDNQPKLHVAYEQLIDTSHYLAKLAERTGRIIHIDLEPEPGCVLSQSSDVANIFEQLYARGDRDIIFRHIRVCHDICHAAVMFEDPLQPFAQYAAADAQVGKIQVSSALAWRLDELCPPDRLLARQQLELYAEPRYLHQTLIRRSPNGHVDFYEDLPDALSQLNDDASRHDEWRVHFHVPIHLKTIGGLGTTQDHIESVTQMIKECDLICPIEIETYAWNVLPDHQSDDDLIRGITCELNWFEDLINA